MKIETIIGLVMAEIDRAEKLHPVWPHDIVKAAAIPVEEAGELLKAANDCDEKHTSRQSMITEAVHTAASAIRFLKNLEEQPHE